MMRLRTLTTLAIAAVSTFTAAGCGSDSPVAPPAATPAPTTASHSLLGSLLGQPRTITPLLRTTPLASDQTASAYIGILGGVLSLPGAGLTVVVPPGAVFQTTLFSVTARAGSNVAYEFSPHGLNFLTPLIATQDLHGTQVQSGLVNPVSLKLGYFPNANNVTSVTELLGVNVNLLGLTSTATIWHFSGYIYASGETASDF